MILTAPMSRLAGGVALVLALFAGLVAAPAAVAQDGNGSVEVHSRICPEGYEGQNWFEDCHGNVPDPGLPFTFTNEDTGETFDGTTNESGNVGFANLPAGTYTLTGGAPGEFTDYVVYCAVGTEGDSNQQRVPVEYVTGGVRFDLPADTNVICDWYTIPLSQQGEPTATPPADTDGSSIEVHNRICPTGYEGESWFEDCHGNVPDPGLPFTFADGVTREGTTNENGNVGFANLPAGGYTITGGAPGEFTDYLVYCSVGTEETGNDQQIPVQYVTGGVQLELPADTNVICDWYTIPLSQDGEPNATITAQPDTFDLPIYKLLCEEDPGATAASDFVMIGTVPAGCEQIEGVTVTVSTADGSELGSCVTEATEPCYVTVPVGTTVYATEDLATVPEGYAPLNGETQEVSIEPATEAWVLFVNVPVQPTATVAPTLTTEPLPEDRPVLITTGTCDDATVGDVVVDLQDLREPEGEPVGHDEAITAETSSSTTSVSLDDLVASDHVVLVFADDDTEATGDPVACAPVGGVVNADGELVIGLEERNGSNYTGIVYLAPSDDDEAQTDVTVFLAEGLAENDPEATPGV